MSQMVLVRLEPCSVCMRDPGFGSVHFGCSKRCKKTWEERDHAQPTLTKVSSDPVVYAEKKRGEAEQKGGE